MRVEKSELRNLFPITCCQDSPCSFLKQMKAVRQHEKFVQFFNIKPSLYHPLPFRPRTAGENPHDCDLRWGRKCHSWGGWEVCLNLNIIRMFLFSPLVTLITIVIQPNYYLTLLLKTIRETALWNSQLKINIDSNERLSNSREVAMLLVYSKSIAYKAASGARFHKPAHTLIHNSKSF